MKQPILAAIFTAACIATAGRAVAAPADNPRDQYTRAMAQERIVRDDATKPTLAQMRRVVAAYEGLVRQHPASGYCDNALWQAGNLAALAFERFGDEADKRTAARLFAQLAREYPSSKLVVQANAAAADLQRPAAQRATAASAAESPAAAQPVAPVSAPLPPATGRAAAKKGSPEPANAGVATLKEVTRTVLPDGIRLTVELDSEVPYYQEEIAGPRRLFFDLKGVKATQGLQDASLKYDGDVVREVRLGRRPENTTRLVVDLEGVGSYSVYPVYGPYRLVIDLRRASALSAPSGISAAAPMPKTVTPPVAAPPPAVPGMVSAGSAASAAATLPEVKQSIPESKPPVVEPAPLPSKPAAPKAASPPVAPASNSNGKFSLSRQLGLGVSRVVIDAGHGGHDPGAHGNGITESELTLDVALRLQKLLKAQEGVEVVMTRDTDVFIPLEERTAIANREGADLFLSIHANASRNPLARGIETYFLNFAMNPEAEAVAARENATSAQAMHSLPDIVKAIALNNKLNESRDLAETVQKSMAKKLSARNRTLKDLGVKQAPFVVLIGAVMPSVLAEISFVTNRQDGALLKTGAYRQQIAQSLFDAIVSYQQGLKRLNSLNGKKATEQ